MSTTTEAKTKEVKCVVWDLDNTVWDGVLLEDENVQLKPGIREVLQTLDSRGILHSIASKNNYEDAIKKLEEFGIKDYFLYPEIHWNPKSHSIANIQKNINIGMDTIVFIDDQKFERDEVQYNHEQVECIDAVKYTELTEMPRMNPRFITVDSGRRRQMYMQDIHRKNIEAEYTGTPEDFLSTLELEFTISKATEEDLKRAEELTVRTHQLNSTGITFDYNELRFFTHSEKHRLYVCELTDKYGSYGKIGLALVEITDTHFHLKLLLMSCRVMSRGVGSVLMSFLMNEAKDAGKKLLADFKKTDRNRQMYVTYKFANFIELDEKENIVLFENDLSFIPLYPKYLKLTITE
ncbi:MAG: HAD-IIIC family phosphatase [Spirochaetales bacterium]|nr:HAD-IIIC family phosphatase [Spirochaetales bacterium]